MRRAAGWGSIWSPPARATRQAFQAARTYDSYAPRAWVHADRLGAGGTVARRHERVLGPAGPRIVPPGHTKGSISLLAEIDGAPVAFTGNLAPGTAAPLHDLQWQCDAGCGRRALHSVAVLAGRGPRRLPPRTADGRGRTPALAGTAAARLLADPP
jgi:glyoxylase-like metal-dependent hydrolase (beta-lactamase superfamily II)